MGIKKLDAFYKSLIFNGLMPLYYDILVEAAIWAYGKITVFSCG